MSQVDYSKKKAPLKAATFGALVVARYIVIMGIKVAQRCASGKQIIGSADGQTSQKSISKIFLDKVAAKMLGDFAPTQSPGRPKEGVFSPNFTKWYIGLPENPRR